ncbi:MAG: divergent polysaccharide deacetylase family protein [Cellvibrionales bacterium]
MILRGAREGALVVVSALLVLATPAEARCPNHSEGQLAIIIDDLGYNLERGQAVASLPAPITLAIIPETPHAQTLAELATAHGKEVMVHMPMASSSAELAEPLVLEPDLTRREINTRIERALASVSGAQGLNNHMGSALTQHQSAMQHLMEALRDRGLYFIDSRTTPDTLAELTARRVGVPAASRSVFLDNVIEAEAIAAQLDKALLAALEQGFAIAIGHPYDETVKVLNEQLPSLPTTVTIVGASAIARCGGVGVGIPDRDPAGGPQAED